MSFGKKIIAGVAAVATLAALAPAVAMADTAQNQNSATSAQAEEEFATVTFYTADGHIIQGTTWQKGTAFSQYALGIQAPAIAGKTFTGWSYSEGPMLKDTDQVFGDISVYATYADTPAQDDNTQYTVSFYAGTDKLIQTVSYYAKDKAKFSQYALGIQAPAVEGKTFTGWGFASNDGDVPVDPDAEVTGNWAVYAMYKDAPKQDNKKDDVKPADTVTKNDAKKNNNKTVAQKIQQAVLSDTGAAVSGVVVFAVIALIGFAGITILRKRI